jgi:hypothetical protein
VTFAGYVLLLLLPLRLEAAVCSQTLIDIRVYQATLCHIGYNAAIFMSDCMQCPFSVTGFAIVVLDFQ